MSEWQPIETAPKDGTWFLTCRAGEEHKQFMYEIGCYDPYMLPEYIEVDGGLFRKEMKPGYEWTGFNNFHRATHWMPLPEPPK